MNFINSKKQGDYGLGTAIQYFTSLGYTVCIPLTDSQDYDLLIDCGSSIDRVQVKTTTVKEPSGSYICSLRLIGGTTGKVIKYFQDLRIDSLFVVSPEGSYHIPAYAVKGRSAISVGNSSYLTFRVG